MYKWCLTLSRLATVHREVGGLVGLESASLHAGTENLDILRVAALSDAHLLTNTSNSGMSFVLSSPPDLDTDILQGLDLLGGVKLLNFTFW